MRTRGVLCALLLAGCGEPETGPEAGGQTGEEMPPACTEAREAVEAGDRSLGFSAAEVLEAHAESTAVLTAADGGTAALILGLAPAEGPVERVDVELHPDWQGDPGVCQDWLAVPVRLSFTTGDGAFAEVWDATLDAWSATEADTVVRVGSDTLAGTWVSPDPTATLVVVARWEAGEPSGTLYLQPAASDDAGGEQVLATWAP